MKKVVCVIISVLLIGALAFTGYKIFKGSDSDDNPNSKWRDEGWFPGEYEAYFVREVVPTDIIWYGEWTGNNYEIPVRFETEVTDDILEIRDGYQKVYIVINDMNGDVGLEDEDYELLCKHITNDERYNFIYIGTQRLKYLAELHGYDPEHVLSDNASIGFYRYGKELHALYGTYMVSDVGKYDSWLCNYLLGSYEDYFWVE